jgi:hypothetical protein
MKIYYNAIENLIGYSTDDVLVRVDEETSIYRVLSNSWELICEV